MLAFHPTLPTFGVGCQQLMYNRQDIGQGFASASLRQDEGWDTWKVDMWMVGGFSPTHLKNMLVKMGSSSPIFGMKIPKMFI